jgi:hypothetical protein
VDDKAGDGKVTEVEANNYLKRMDLCSLDAVVGESSSFAYSDKKEDRFLSLMEISSGYRNDDYSQQYFIDCRCQR